MKTSKATYQNYKKCNEQACERYNVIGCLQDQFSAFFSCHQVLRSKVLFLISIGIKLYKSAIATDKRLSL